jgi:homoserine dehydrogenase
MRHLRLSIVGFGVVGRWLADAVVRRRSWLQSECDVTVSIVGVATRRAGLIHRDGGLDVPSLLEDAMAGPPWADAHGAHRWPTALDGLSRTDYDVLVETSNTNPREPEPTSSHIRMALERGAHVVTSSKGACAHAALELLALARQRGIQLRMESTVMSGTPVLGTIREGLAGARVLSVRGILNGTANHILTSMAEGLDYAAALADAQARGYAEPDPTDDVEGHDVVAKTRILAAVAFGRGLSLDQVAVRGIAAVTTPAVKEAARRGYRIKLLATLRVRAGNGRESLEARVEPAALPLADPLARVDGVLNAVTIETDTVREVTIVGPGAGREQAGQGVFADLVAVARGHGGPPP